MPSRNPMTRSRIRASLPSSESQPVSARISAGRYTIPKLYSGRDKTFLLQLGIGQAGARSACRVSESFRRRRRGAGDLRGLVDSRTQQPITLKDPLTSASSTTLSREPHLSKEALTFPAVRAASKHTTGHIQFRFELDRAPCPIRTTTTDVSITAFGTKATVSGPLCIQRHLRSGHSVLGARRAQQSGTLAELSTNYTHTLNPSLINDLRVGRINSAKLKSSARRTIPHMTWSARWACRCLPAG